MEAILRKSQTVSAAAQSWGGNGVRTGIPNSCPQRWRHRCRHLETPAGIGLGAREEMGSSFQHSPEAMAVHKLGVGMGMWAEDSLPSQRLS